MVLEERVAGVEEFGLDHATVQIEAGACPDDRPLYPGRAPP